MSLFADDVVLLTYLKDLLQLAPRQLAAEREATGMKIGTCKSETRVLTHGAHSRSGMTCCTKREPGGGIGVCSDEDAAQICCDEVSTEHENKIC